MALLVEKESSAVIFWCAVSPTNGRQIQRDPNDLELLHAVVDHYDLIEWPYQCEEYESRLVGWYECGQTRNKPARPELPELYFVAKAALSHLTGEAISVTSFRVYHHLHLDLLEEQVKADYGKFVDVALVPANLVRPLTEHRFWLI